MEARQDNEEERRSVIVDRLKNHYPDPHPFLDVHSPLESLVATILSAQTTDKQVNKVIKDLFRKYRSAEDYARATPEGLGEDIRTIGFNRVKARYIIDSARIIMERHGGRVPDDVDELIALPGVGRKTANIVMSNGYGKNTGIPVDTHMKRVTTRLGLTKKAVPDRIEEDLEEIVPRDDWFHFAYAILMHGRETCKAPIPYCSRCFLVDLCPKAGVKARR